MTSIIKNIFNPNQLLKAVIDTGDALVFTNEEQAKMKAELLKQFEPFKLAQRLLALLFTINFILAFWTSVVLYIWFPDLASGFLGLVEAYQLGWIMLAIVSFYFTGGIVNTFNKDKK